MIVTIDESMSERLFAASDTIATDPDSSPIISFRTAMKAFDAMPIAAVRLRTFFLVPSSTILAILAMFGRVYKKRGVL